MSKEQDDKFWEDVRRAMTLYYAYKPNDAIAEIAQFRRSLPKMKVNDLIERFGHDSVAEMLGEHNLDRIKTERFDDNRMVATSRHKDSDGKTWSSHEYLQVSFREYDRKWPEMPQSVSLIRYCVPGRIDTYNFDYADSHASGVGERIRYYTEGGSLPMTKALEMLQKDIDKPTVINMLVEFCEVPGRLYYTRILVKRLLSSIAPKTKAYKKLKIVLAKLEKAHQERIAKRQAERDALEKAGLAQ